MGDLAGTEHQCRTQSASRKRLALSDRRPLGGAPSPFVLVAKMLSLCLLSFGIAAGGFLYAASYASIAVAVASVGRYEFSLAVGDAPDEIVSTPV